MKTFSTIQSPSPRLTCSSLSLLPPPISTNGRSLAPTWIAVISLDMLRPPRDASYRWATALHEHGRDRLEHQLAALVEQAMARAHDPRARTARGIALLDHLARVAQLVAGAHGRAHLELGTQARERGPRPRLAPRRQREPRPDRDHVRAAGDEPAEDRALRGLLVHVVVARVPLERVRDDRLARHAVGLAPGVALADLDLLEAGDLVLAPFHGRAGEHARARRRTRRSRPASSALGSQTRTTSWARIATPHAPKNAPTERGEVGSGRHGKT